MTTPRQYAPVPADRTRFYGVWVSNRATSRRGTALVWGPPRDTPGEAARDGRAALAAGDATLALVVEIGPGVRRVLDTWTRPSSAEKVVAHLREVEKALAHGPSRKT